MSDVKERMRASEKHVGRQVAAIVRGQPEPGVDYVGVCETLAAGVARIEELEAALVLAQTAIETAVCIANDAVSEWDAAQGGMKVGKILLALAGHRKGYLASADSVHAALETCSAALNGSAPLRRSE